VPILVGLVASRLTGDHVKKCTSCAKDLPDSALHCVFCGAKQASAPVPGAAAQQAKTVLGYQAADVVKEMQRQAQARPGGGSQPQPMQPMQPMQPPMGRPGGGSQPPPMMGPPMGQQPMGPPMGQQPMGMQQMPRPNGPSQPPPMGQPLPHQAATMFIPGGAGPGPLPMSSGPIGVPGPMGNPPSAPVQMPMPGAPQQLLGQMPSAPAAAPPYLASQTAARAARPIEPYADGLKLILLSFGILLLGAFATPISTDPMAFHWNTIIDAPGMAKLFSLMLAATGVLSLVIALIPLGAIGRGSIAAALGLFIVATPIIQAGDIGAWQQLLGLVGSLTLVGGLLLRHEYREASLGRILATVGALCVLATYLIPVGGGDVPLVAKFTAIIDAPLVEQKIGVIIDLLPAVLAILSLLCWLPAPGTGGAKVFAWMWIIYPAFASIAGTFIASGGDVGGIIKQSPFAALMLWVPFSAAVAFVGYGVATVLGKRLE